MKKIVILLCTCLSVNINVLADVSANRSSENKDSVLNDGAVNSDIINLKTNNDPINKTKQTLIEKLRSLNAFSAQFSQKVYDNEMQLLQQGAGNIQVAKPNKIYWQTTEPEETLIVSDGNTLWFYDPFIEQASAYSLQESIANTPILLIINEDPAIWAQYDITQLSDNQFQINALDEQSQVKTLIITFNKNEITELIITDATGQQSFITLTERKYNFIPDESLFNFVVPDGVNIDDQR